MFVQLGDPTAYGNMPPCPTIVKAITRALNSPGMAAGYVNACGTPEARAAIASHHATAPDNVIVANGASGALELALTALLDEGSVLLVPRPGFPLYGVIAESHGASVVHYDLLPDQGWECDLDHIESILSKLNQYANERTGENSKVVRGILVNNPSNPTGAVYSEVHLAQIAKLAAKYQIPIVSDEIYGDMTLNGHVFYPMADIVESLGRIVPVITASGIGKQCEFDFLCTFFVKLSHQPF
jgi:tyrosine aminotransferase